MGKRYDQHSDLCGCERCAREAEKDNPGHVYDVVDDPEIRDCGCPMWRSCDCDYWDAIEDDGE